MIGRTIGKYRILEALGRGGMGTVYKAVDQTLEREVAIKVLNPELLDGENLVRFRAEALTLAKLNHARIATLYEFVNEPDALLMVMEYVRGETLERMATRTGPLPLQRAAHLCLQALDALRHAHGCGIVHRDLKPANLMVTPDGDLKVMDFGIARVVGTEHLTSGGFMMGTPAYMAPEQVRGWEVDERTDLYAMGIVLYRLVTGRLPFKVDTAVAMIQAQLNDSPTPVGEIRGDMPQWFQQVLTCVLDKTPDRRYQKAEEFRDALMTGLQMTPVSGPVVGTTAQFAQTMLPMPTPVGQSGVGFTPARSGSFTPVRSGSIAQPTPVAASTVVQVPTLRQGFQAASLLAALAVIALLGGALAYLLLGDRTPADQPPLAQAVAPPEPSPPLAAPANISSVEPAPPAPLVVEPAPQVAVQPPTPAAAMPPAPAPAPVAAPPRAVRTTSPVPQGSGAARAANPTEKPAPVLAETAAPPVPTPLAEVRPTEPPDMIFEDVVFKRTVGSENEEHDGILTLGGGYVSFTIEDQTEPAKKLPYRALVSAKYSTTRVSILRLTRHWLSLHTKDDFMVMQLDGDNVNLILPAIESRTGLKVERVKDAK